MAWKHIPFSARLAFEVPLTPGVYAIVRADRVHGLPVEWEILYVGKSLDLRRRFRDHVTPWRERSQMLRTSPVYTEAGWEFWFQALPAETLDQAERELIVRSKPTANVLQYKGEHK